MPTGHGGKRHGGVGHPKDEYIPRDIRERLVVAKAEREEQLGRLAALEVAEREGRLVPADAATKAQKRSAMAFRDAMLSIPGREAAKLAGIADEREIERLLTFAIRAELTRVADGALDDAA